MSRSVLCPSCRQPAHAQFFAKLSGGLLELDICFACQGLWFDRYENTQLAPAAVLQLFEQLHTHRGDAHHPVAQHMQCPRCSKALVAGFDVAKGGRYVTYRCAERHGRFSTFGAFMVEKGFVRHLSDREVDALAVRVGTISCAHCGGAVDIRKDHACPYCRSAVALLDPQAVQKALERHAEAARATPPPSAHGSTNPEQLADALVAIERERQRELRTQERERYTGMGTSDRFDLFSAGVELVWELLKRS